MNPDTECARCRKRPPYCRCQRPENVLLPPAKRLGFKRKHLQPRLAGKAGIVERKIITDLDWLYERDPKNESQAMGGAKYAYSRCLDYLRTVERNG